jgi:membrane-bound serine protease (ClpP class)
MRNLLSFIFLIALINISLYSQSKKIYWANIDAEIDLGMAPYISRVVSEANEAGADAIIFRINTFGGRLDAATQIRDAILSSKALTIAYVNDRAISAGALITLSCKKITMVPGSSIGAATVVNQAGEKQSEKYQSYMRGEMRSTAERNGRRTDIAQGMVDERIIIKGLVDSTQLVTLTDREAKKYGIADTLVSDKEELLKAFNLENAQIITINQNWAEDVVKFLNNPVVSTILILIGFFGLIAEIKTPGWGLPGTAGVVALLLFFGSSYILQLASALDIILFVAGVILLALEIFVIPGFGITGISGIILIFVSLFLALTPSGPFFNYQNISVAIVQLTASLVGALILVFLLAKFLPKTSAFNRLILADAEKADQGFVSYPSEKELLGVEGIALTTLRPAGSAEFNGKRVDVVADWEYIERGKKIKVLRVEGIKVVVKEVKE